MWEPRRIIGDIIQGWQHERLRLHGHKKGGNKSKTRWHTKAERRGQTGCNLKLSERRLSQHPYPSCRQRSRECSSLEINILSEIDSKGERQ